MNTVHCGGCGDAHLCPGTPTQGAADPNLTDTLRRFIDAAFEKNPISYVSSAGAYLAYLNWCTDHDRPPYSQRRFINAMAGLGYRRVKRSTMRIQGLAWKTPHNRGRHAAPEEPMALAR